jgi:quercetin dioxygenase-like cupin family protein
MREIRCADLDEALAAHQAQGFRLDTIVPADDPTELSLSRGDEQLRLVRDAPARLHDGAWHRGRAGMDYRDLVPDRRGGAIIASHIRIEQGGPVPDYVHFHDIRVQLIYCLHGWVRLVYEDQGEPFVMTAGDCVVQPPQIRHRVLECSPGLEVIEVTAPAVHATHVDHVLALPTPRRERTYAGQSFAWCRPGELDRVAAATGGLAAIRVANGELAISVHDPLGGRHEVVVALGADR